MPCVAVTEYYILPTFRRVFTFEKKLKKETLWLHIGGIGKLQNETMNSYFYFYLYFFTFEVL